MENLKNVNEELLEDIKDIKEKLEDCLQSIESGRGLDSTQQAFLSSVNIDVEEY